MREEIRPIDVNQASREALIAVPGVGPHLADRIIAARPFQRLEDLTRVPGIGPNLLERLRPYLTVGEEPTPATEDPPVANPIAIEAAEEEPPAAEEVASSAEAEPSPQAGPSPDSGEVAEPPETAPPPEVPTRPTPEPGTSPWGMALISGALSFLLAVIVTLGVLGALNGGLRYASPEEMQALAQQTTQINHQMAQLDERLQAMDRRLSRVEHLAQQVDDLNAQVTALQDDLKGAQQQLAEAQQQMETLHATMTSMQDQVSMFQRFLDGLRDLLGQVQPEEPSQGNGGEP